MKLQMNAKHSIMHIITEIINYKQKKCYLPRRRLYINKKKSIFAKEIHILNIHIGNTE